MAERRAGMTRGFLGDRALLVALALLALVAFLAFAWPRGHNAGGKSAEGTDSPAAPLRVDGNELVDPGGAPVQLRGVNEAVMLGCYLDESVRGFIDEPQTQATVDALRSWGVNAVRLTLSEGCWLGNNRGPDSVGLGRPYRRKLTRWVRLLGANGIYAILDLHTVAPGTRLSVGLPREPYVYPAPDRSHSQDFWSGVASRFRTDPNVLFDVFNEPWGMSWRCWLRGCKLRRKPLIEQGGPAARRIPLYRTAGAQSLVDAIRSTGAEQPILVAGLHFANDLDRWLDFRPRDPLGQIVASLHTYGKSCPSGRPIECWPAATRVGAEVPVVVGEFGELRCGHVFNESLMDWADAAGFSYLAWIWASKGWAGAGCRTHSLIAASDGTPTSYGAPIRDHLRRSSAPRASGVRPGG